MKLLASRAFSCSVNPPPSERLAFSAISAREKPTCRFDRSIKWLSILEMLKV